MSEVNTYDLHIHQGETWELVLTRLDANDEPVALTGYSAFMSIKDRPGGRLYTTLTSSDSEITIVEADGEIEVNMSATDTGALPFVEAYYDIAIKSVASTVTYLLKGRVMVARRITEVP